MSKIAAFLKKLDHRSWSVEEGASLLARASRIEPALSPAAEAAAVIHHVAGEGERGRNALFTLLESEAVAHPLSILDDARLAALERTLGIPPDRLADGWPFSETSALQAVAGRIVSLNGCLQLSSILEGVALAGGLPRVVLALEEGLGLISLTDAEQATEALASLEQRFIQFRAAKVRRGRGSVTIVQEGMRITSTRRVDGLLQGGGKKAASVKSSLLEAVTLADFFEKEWPRRNFPKGEYPRLVGDMLLNRLGTAPISGSCVGRHLLGGHLGLLTGRRYQSLFYPAHTNLYDLDAGMVINFDPGVLGFSLLADWREIGALGPEMIPQPFGSIIAALLPNLNVVLRPPAVLESLPVVVGIYPDYPRALVNLAQSVVDDDQVVRLLTKGLSANPREPMGWAEIARRCDKYGNRDGEIAALEVAWHHAVENRKASQRIFYHAGFGAGSEDLAYLFFVLSGAYLQAGRDLASLGSHLTEGLKAKGFRDELVTILELVLEAVHAEGRIRSLLDQLVKIVPPDDPLRDRLTTLQAPEIG